MKTSKKGFTLIELIVVIAIIGVLAAILVPAMLGYVKKSKISAANSAASSIDKAIDSTLTDLEAKGTDISGDFKLMWDIVNGTGSWSAAAADLTRLQGASSTDFTDGVNQYFSDIKKTKHAIVQLYNGTCVAVACTVDNTYWGSVPSGIVTPKNSDSMKSDTLFTQAKTSANYS